MKYLSKKPLFIEINEFCIEHYIICQNFLIFCRNEINYLFVEKVCQKLDNRKILSKDFVYEANANIKCYIISVFKESIKI